VTLDEFAAKVRQIGLVAATYELVSTVEKVGPVVEAVYGMTRSGGRLGVFGKTPVLQQKVTVPAVTQKATTVTVGNSKVLRAESAEIIDSNTERLNQIEAALKAYGLLP
jgi:hypothetical protein